jgi:hypothetical protein
MAAPEGFVFALGIAPKPNRILLARQDGRYCAIRFSRLERGNDRLPATSTHSGEETFQAQYEWTELRAEQTGFFSFHAQGQGTLAQGALVGVGRMAFGRGKSKISCAGIEFNWSPPTTAYFYSGNKPIDAGIEFSATDWRDFSSLGDISSLTWYRLDLKRNKVTIGE